MACDIAKLAELGKAEDRAEHDVLMAARIWRSYQREKDRKFSALWLKKLAAAVDAEDAARQAWRDEYSRQITEERAEAAALAAFEAEGGHLDAKKERFEEWRSEVALPKLHAARASEAGGLH